MSLIDQARIARIRPLNARRQTLTKLVSLWRSRRALAHLDTRALKDIGISQTAADIEASRSIWDVPHTWKNE